MPDALIRSWKELTRLWKRPAPLPALRPGPPLIILGMHRSGTSFLTGSLQLAGLELGPHNQAARHNKKGNRENPEIVAFHEEVLAARGALWRRAPDEDILWTPEEEVRARALVASYDGGAHWGFKDPRSLLMIDEWQRICPQAGLIGIFRNPMAVTQSLLTRGMEITEAEAHALWKRTNEALLRLHRAAPFPLFCFDESARTLHRKLNAVLPRLGLNPLKREVFFSPDLKHHTESSRSIPPDLRDLYDALQALQC